MTSMSGAGATASAEVEITTVGGLTDFSSAMKSRSETLASELADLRVQFTNKASGNEGQAIDQYLATMKGFEDALYEQFPAAITEFAGAFDSYVNDITGLGFSADDDLRTSSTDVARYKARMTTEGSPQKTEVEDRVDGVKTVLEKVAAEVADYESPASSLDWEKDDIKSHLDTLGTSIDNVHNGLTDAKSGFVSKLDAFNSTLDGFSGVMNRIQFFSDPNSGFSPANMKAMISSEKMTAETISEYFAAAGSLTDSQAISYYLQNKHDEFAKLNPDDISEPTYYIIVDNMNNRLVAGDSKVVKDIENLSNAILMQPDSVSDKFFNNFAVGAEKVASLAYSSAIVIDKALRNVEGSEAYKAYQKAIENLNGANHLVGLFEAIIVADAHQEKRNILGYEFGVDDSSSQPLDRNTKIKGLKFTSDNGGFTFWAFQETSKAGEAIKGSQSEAIYHSTKTVSSDTVDDNEVVAKLNELREQRSAILSKWMEDMGKEAISLVPYGSVLVTIAENAENFGSGTGLKVAEGTTDSVSAALDELEFKGGTQLTKTATGFSALTKTLSAISEYQQLTADIAKTKDKLKEKLFDNRGVIVDRAGTTVYADTYTYDLQAYETMVEWEASGMRSDIETDVKAKHDNYQYTDKQREDVRAKAITEVQNILTVNKQTATQYVDFVLYGQDKVPNQSFEKMGIETYNSVRNEIEGRYQAATP